MYIQLLILHYYLSKDPEAYSNTLKAVEELLAQEEGKMIK
jgi:hypothetical protein